MTPKEWAIANGYDVKPGRGRMASHITDAYRKAMGQQATAPKVKGKAKSQASPVGVQETAPALHSLDAKVYAFINGKKVYGTMRAACFHSGLSLCWCPCPSHRAIVSNTSGYVPVIVED